MKVIRFLLLLLLVAVTCANPAVDNAGPINHVVRKLRISLPQELWSMEINDVLFFVMFFCFSRAKIRHPQRLPKPPWRSRSWSDWAPSAPRRITAPVWCSSWWPTWTGCWKSPALRSEKAWSWHRPGTDLSFNHEFWGSNIQLVIQNKLLEAESKHVLQSKTSSVCEIVEWWFQSVSWSRCNQTTVHSTNSITTSDSSGYQGGLTFVLKIIKKCPKETTQMLENVYSA